MVENEMDESVPVSEPIPIRADADEPERATQPPVQNPAAKKRRTKPRRARSRKPTTQRTVRQQRTSARTFPASTFQDALVLAEAIQQEASGDRIRRLTLFSTLGKSPDSGPSRQLVTNSSRYGLTSGSYKAEYLELTREGRLATTQDGAEGERLRIRFQLAINDISPFKAIHDNYRERKLPSQAVLKDFVRELGVSEADIQECIETFILNAKFLGLLKTIAGAEWLVSMEQVLEESAGAAAFTVGLPAESVERLTATDQTSDNIEWSKMCFYVTPIGAEGSEERRHSDLFLSALVEPAVQEFGLRVVRADQIGKAGMITAQIIEHLVKARIVIADLSYHNPNVFYELCLRHARRLPIVQITRAADPIPFDLDQVRTIRIDTTDIFSLVPRLETYRSEISNQVRRALNDAQDVDNPLSVFYPTFWDSGSLIG